MAAFNKKNSASQDTAFSAGVEIRTLIKEYLLEAEESKTVHKESISIFSSIYTGFLRGKPLPKKSCFYIFGNIIRLSNKNASLAFSEPLLLVLIDLLKAIDDNKPNSGNADVIEQLEEDVINGNNPKKIANIILSYLSNAIYCSVHSYRVDLSSELSKHPLAVIELLDVLSTELQNERLLSDCQKALLSSSLLLDDDSLYMLFTSKKKGEAWIGEVELLDGSGIGEGVVVNITPLTRDIELIKSSAPYILNALKHDLLARWIPEKISLCVMDPTTQGVYYVTQSNKKTSEQIGVEPKFIKTSTASVSRMLSSLVPIETKCELDLSEKYY